MQRILYQLLRQGLVIVCLLLAATGAARAAAGPVLVLGDSISAAYGMSLDQGWVALLGRELEARSLRHPVVNASISGETSAGGLRRLPALLDRYRPAVVIIELGGNDGLRGFPLASLRANLTQLVQLAQDSGAATVLLPMEIPPNYGARYAAGFREIFREVAQANGSQLAPFILDGIATNAGLMQPDGIHPTSEAQPALLANVLPAVLAALGAQ